MRRIRMMVTIATCAGALLVSSASFSQDAPKTSPAFRAGFARTDLTPPVGAEVPGGFHKSFSKGIHDPLFAEAAVFSDGTTQVAVVGVDLIMLPRDVVADARRQAESLCGVPAANILLAASHTHNGGPVVDCLGSERDPEYCRTAATRIAQAIAAAHAAMQDARLAADSGEVHRVGFNRRFKMKDGSVKTHPGKMNPDIVEPAGPVDPEVAVIAVENTQGELLGCIVNHAMHGTTLGGNEISADWPCYLRKTIRGGVGADIGVVFLNGACGDVTQVNNQSPPPTEFGEGSARFVGMTVGAEALKIIARAKFSDTVPLKVVSEAVQLPIRDLAANDAELLTREAPGAGLGSGVEDIYAKEAALVREMKAKSPVVTEEVQVLGIGPAAIVSNPTEYFCALGLAIKKDAPAKPVMIAELSNGYAGYAPTADAFTGGGYEVRTARSSFLAPGAGEQLVDVSRRLLAKLRQ